MMRAWTRFSWPCPSPGGALAQYAGRLHHLHHAKREVVIYDYVDINISVLFQIFVKRRRGYKALGYTPIEDK